MSWVWRRLGVSPPTRAKLQKIASEKEAWNSLLTPAATATHPWMSGGKWMDDSRCSVILRIINNRIIFTLTKLRDLGGNIKMFNEEQQTETGIKDRDMC